MLYWLQLLMSVYRKPVSKHSLCSGLGSFGSFNVNPRASWGVGWGGCSSWLGKGPGDHVTKVRRLFMESMYYLFSPVTRRARIWHVQVNRSMPWCCLLWSRLCRVWDDVGDRWRWSTQCAASIDVFIIHSLCLCMTPCASLFLMYFLFFCFKPSFLRLLNLCQFLRGSLPKQHVCISWSKHRGSLLPWGDKGWHRLYAAESKGCYVSPASQ